MALHTRLLLISSLLIALAATAGARSLKGTAAGSQTLLGRAAVLSIDSRSTHSRMVVVHTDDGQRVPLQASEQQLAHIRSGQRLAVTGAWRVGPRAATAATAGTAARRSFSVANIVATDGGPVAAPPRLTAQPVAGRHLLQSAVVRSTNQLVVADVSTVFIPIRSANADGSSCPGSGPVKYTAQQVRAAVFADSNPGGITVGSLFDQCSFGKTKLTSATSCVLETVTLPCNGTDAYTGLNWSFNTCDFNDFDGWASAADAQVQAAGIDLSKYKYRVYLLPPSQCGWLGLGYVGCDGSFTCRAWIHADAWTSPQPIIHELGHNLYMGHATRMNDNGMVDDYGDSTCFMGHCCDARCPNTPHSWQLGWLSVQQLDGTSLTPGATVTATLPSSSVSAQSGLRVVPNWVAGAAPVFLGVRSTVGGDAGLSASLAGQVQVYTANITNTFDATNSETRWEGTLVAGAAWTQPAAGLVVRVKAVSAAGATVTLCRKAGAETPASCAAGLDNDCNGLVGPADPACPKPLVQSIQPIPRRRVARPPRGLAKKALVRRTAV